MEDRSTENDDQATGHTIGRMSEYVIQDAGNELVRRTAYQAVREYPGRSSQEAVFNWVQSHITFVEDTAITRHLRGIPNGENAEVLIRPVDILTMPKPQGDCASFSMLTAAMLRALGVPSSFRAVAAEDPNFFSHVYVVAHSNGKEIPIDTSHGPNVGWEVRPTGKVKTWPIQEGTRMRAKPNSLGALPSWATELFKLGAETGATIATERWGQPPEGTYIQRNGEVIYRQQEGAPSYAFPGASLDFGTSGNTKLFMIAGVVLLAIVILRMGK